MAGGAMLKYVRPMVTQVIGTMAQQISILEEAGGQIRSLLPQLKESWIGEDADAFSGEVGQRFFPEVAAVVTAVGAFVAAFSRAAQVIERADRDAKGMAENLRQELSRVF